MKSILTSRHKLTTLEITILGGVGLIVSIISVMSLRIERVKDFDLLLRASENTQTAYDAIKESRLALRLGLDSINDPAYTGLIGPQNSPVTTGPGDLEAKQTSLDPNWAALIIRYLQKAGVAPGDPVAVSMTGSFPGLNCAVLVAIETYGARPLSIVSQGSTSWGANHPAFTWLDMERVLFEKSILSARSIAATIGGNNNIGAGLDDLGRATLVFSINHQGIPLISGGSLSTGIDSAMAMYSHAAQGKRIPLFINIGSGYLSLGTMNTGTILSTGMNSPSRLLKLRAEPIEGVAARFLAQGAMVLNLYDIVSLARSNCLPIAPAVTPQPGMGKLFRAPRYRIWVNVVLLVFYILVVLAFANGYTNFLTKNPRKKEML